MIKNSKIIYNLNLVMTFTWIEMLELNKLSKKLKAIKQNTKLFVTAHCLYLKPF